MNHRTLFRLEAGEEMWENDGCCGLACPNHVQIGFVESAQVDRIGSVTAMPGSRSSCRKAPLSQASTMLDIEEQETGDIHYSGVADNLDMFEDVAVLVGAQSEPILEQTEAWLGCRLVCVLVYRFERGIENNGGIRWRNKRVYVIQAILDVVLLVNQTW